MPRDRATPDSTAAFDEEAVHSRPKELVRKTVEDTLNVLFEEEADDLAEA